MTPVLLFEAVDRLTTFLTAGVAALGAFDLCAANWTANRRQSQSSPPHELHQLPYTPRNGLAAEAACGLCHIHQQVG